EVEEGQVAYLMVKNAMRYHWYLTIPGILLYFVYFYGFEKGERPVYLLYAALLFIFASLGYNLYYSLISRKDYLVLEKDTTTLFGK
ncbi:MAG TPA: hypothetical protein VHM26_01145, partial [Chitinophagaceae bacterium]|nr:hypothetical protein [Chitinophagaceae bacterium]